MNKYNQSTIKNLKSARKNENFYDLPTELLSGVCGTLAPPCGYEPDHKSAMSYQRSKFSEEGTGHHGPPPRSSVTSLTNTYENFESYKELAIAFMKY